jgi:two-component system sensor histidine kinase KdpD
VLLEKDETLAVCGGYPVPAVLGAEDMAAALLTWKGCAAPNRESHGSAEAWMFLTLRTGRSAVGVLGIKELDETRPAGADQNYLREALADQTALAVERVHLVEEIDRGRRSKEMERLRAALLNSVSHDLGTPLAIIRASAELLRDGPRAEDDGAGALADIINECDRLDRFINGLLDMTKLQSGAIAPNFGVHDVRDVIEVALQLAKNRLLHHRTELHLDPHPTPVYVDPVLLERALVNVLDNATKYAPTGTTIVIQSSSESDAVYLRVLDRGKGIPNASLDRIFEKFYRVEKTEAPAGTGLGLAIARGFVEAVQGTISAANRSDGAGAVFTISLPRPKKEGVVSRGDWRA